MINTLKPPINHVEGSNPDVNREKHGEVLNRLMKDYGKPEEKMRDPVKKLGKDEFFKIMLTQIKNQDPTNPYKNEEMASQLAQFTSLEQMFNMNKNLEKLADTQQPLHHLGAAGLIGKYVTSDSSFIRHEEGKYSDINFELPADAAKVKVAIINDRGETIQEITKENLQKGPSKIEWDGRRSNNMTAPTGSYHVQIAAETAQGKAFAPVTTHKNRVSGVSFEGKDTVLLVGDEKSPQKILLSAVARIEDGVAEDRQKSQRDHNQGQLQSQGKNENETNENKIVADAIPGQANRYAAVDVASFRGEGDTGSLQSSGALPANDAHDLSEANPLAQAVKEGRNPTATNQNKSLISEINPAALAFGPKNIPAAEGSLAGKLLERTGN